LKEKREYGNDHSAPPWVTAYDYAPGGHLVCTTLPDGETLHRRYDACGRMTEAGDDTSSLTWQYDRFGRLTAEYQERVTTRYRYDELGRLSGVMQPDGQWQQFSYDAGRLTQLHLGGTLLARWQYDGKTRLSAWQQGNGLLHQYRYDSRGRRTLHRQTLHDAVRRTQAFQYSPDGRLTDISGDDPRRYHYDDAGRLLQAELPHQRPEGQPEEGFTWDTTGNRVWHPHQAQQDVTGNRLLKYVGTRMTFDRFGRLTEQHGFRGVTRHHYDCRHRLVRSELPDGQQVTYTYDVLNRRTSKTAHGETRYFFWHGTRLSGEMLSGRRDYRGYIYHPGSWTPLAQTHHHALMQTPQVWWYGTDTTGAPVELTDTAGETVWRAQRLAWGNLTDEAWL
ncbi:RHS domain-containing protein, partial [Enterobacter soli]|uniref:RHS domain-containing protein n=1 Tax=Enterobacter soli TaxID=885040 RepID=UPI00325A8044